jgi:hypothetical protein
MLKLAVDGACLSFHISCSLMTFVLDYRETLFIAPAIELVQFFAEAQERAGSGRLQVWLADS